MLIESVDSNLPKGFKPYHIYSIMLDHFEIGRIVYREGTNEERYFDGHIGYEIYEAYRGHHYSYEAVKLLQAIYQRDMIITCDPDNIPSNKILHKLNAVLLETKEIPLQQRKFFSKNERIKNIYLLKWELNGKSIKTD